jgi:anti-sigma factor RsiW
MEAEMNHDEIAARISDIDDAEIPAAEKAALQAHLSACEACRASLAAWRAARKAFFTPAAPPSRAATENFVRTVMARVEAPAPRFDWRALLIPAFGLAAVAAVFAVASPRSADPVEALLDQNQSLYAWSSQAAPQSRDEVLSFATEGR